MPSIHLVASLLGSCADLAFGRWMDGIRAKMYFYLQLRLLHNIALLCTAQIEKENEQEAK